MIKTSQAKGSPQLIQGPWSAPRCCIIADWRCEMQLCSPSVAAGALWPGRLAGQQPADAYPDAALGHWLHLLPRVCHPGCCPNLHRRPPSSCLPAKVTPFPRSFLSSGLLLAQACSSNVQMRIAGLQGVQQKTVQQLHTANVARESRRVATRADC